MKRSNITRRTPLKRISAKRKVLNAKANPARKAFVEAAGVCMVCETHWAAHCHEVGRGNAREASLKHPELWMALCPSCHKAIHESNKDNWCLER